MVFPIRMLQTGNGSRKLISRLAHLGRDKAGGGGGEEKEEAAETTFAY